MEKYEKKSAIKKVLPQELLPTLDLLVKKFGGEERSELIERLYHYTTSAPYVVGKDNTRRLYSELFDLLSKHTKYALDFLRHLGGYYSGVSIETESASYGVWKDSTKLFDQANQSILAYLIGSCVIPIQIPRGEVQERKERSYAVVKFFEENIDWLNLLKPELAGIIIIHIGRVYAYLTDANKVNRLMGFYRKTLPLIQVHPELREIIKNGDVGEVFGMDISTAMNHTQEALDNLCNRGETSICSILN